MNQASHPTVILGGGFAGLFTALHLSHQNYPHPLVLIERGDRFDFKPLLYEVLTGELHSQQVCPQYAELLSGSGVSFVRDTVKSVDLRQRRNVANGFYQTVLTQKLQLWGPFPAGWEGVGPLPPLIAIPYAWLLPLAEIVLGALFALGYWVRWTGLLLILITFSIVLAFGIIPAGSLFPNAAESFNKNIMFMTLIWMCMAYEVDRKKVRMRRMAERMYKDTLEART